MVEKRNDRKNDRDRDRGDSSLCRDPIVDYDACIVEQIRFGIKEKIALFLLKILIKLHLVR
ncbi:hypothetical protein AAGT10_14960 (plasmid) [Sulfolobus tengchongensis]